jgi:SOS-response transcriptional repressor LexA
MDKQGDILRLLREKAGLTQGQLAELVGLTRSGLGHRETGRIRISPGEWSTFAKALNMKLDEFEGMLNARPTQNISTGRIPLIGTIPAGWSRTVLADDTGDYVLKHSETGDRLFACVVTGDSMEPALREGDVVVFQDCAQEGDEHLLKDGKVIAVSWNNGEVCVARMKWISDRQIQLTKDNPKYKGQKVSLDTDTLARIGVLVNHRKDWA